MIISDRWRLVKEGLRERRCLDCDDPITPHDSFYTRTILEPKVGLVYAVENLHLECYERRTANL